MEHQRNLPYLVILAIAIVGVTAVYGQMFAIQKQIRNTQTNIFVRTETAVSNIRQDILRANSGQLHDYDGITSLLKELGQLQKGYSEIGKHQSLEEAYVSGQAEGIYQLIGAFIQQTEAFISGNVLLQNSLRYLSKVVRRQEGQGSLTEDRRLFTKHTQQLLQLLVRETLQYARWPLTSTKTRIADLATELQSSASASNEETHEMLNSLISHAMIVLAYSDRGLEQIHEILNSELPDKVQALRAMFSEKQSSLNKQQGRYRLAFYVLLIALIGITMFYMVRLKVIANVLGNTNRKLEEEIEGNARIGQQLRESEQRLSQIFSQSHDGILVVDIENDRITDCNTAAGKMFGKSCDQIRSTPATMLLPRDLKEIRTFSTNVEESVAKDNAPYVFESKSLEAVEFSLSFFDAAHKDRVLVTARDIGDRFRAEQLVRVQRKILEMIATRTELPTILDAVCEEVSGVIPDSVCTVMLFDRDQKVLNLVAGPQIPSRAKEALTGFPIGTHAASCGTAAYYGEPVIVSDIDADPKWASYREFADEYGLQACWSIPILDDDGGVLGTFAISRFRKGRPEYVESEWLSTASHLAGIAIQRQRVEEQIKYQAYHDFLTDLPNRTLFQDRLSQALSRHYRHNQIGAVLFLDLDHFKNINDSLGHPVGDLLLKGLAARLQTHIRVEDTVARLGGDEFVVLLSELGTLRDEAAAEARVVANKLRAHISQYFEVGGHRLHITPSIGIVLFPTDADSVDEIMRHADTSMYRAKSQGRDNIQFFMPAMANAASARLTMETELRHVLEKDELRLFYQPQVDFATGKIIGAEALLRWEHPRRGMVSPAEFIPILETTGLILPVGEWVLREACNQMIAWDSNVNDTGIKHLAVNVSPRQFRQPDFVEQVERVIEDTGIDTSRLELELTEGIVIQEIDDTIAKMRALKTRGVRFSIDDFGTGYSSLAYLKRLPVDVLKIDRSFVQELPHDKNDAAIVETIIAMAKHFDVDTIAEGVETVAQLEFLKEQNCLAYQGYYFSRPVTADEFLAFFTRKVV